MRQKDSTNRGTWQASLESLPDGTPSGLSAVTNGGLRLLNYGFQRGGVRMDTRRCQDRVTSKSDIDMGSFRNVAVPDTPAGRLRVGAMA